MSIKGSRRIKGIGTAHLQITFLFAMNVFKIKARCFVTFSFSFLWLKYDIATCHVMKKVAKFSLINTIDIDINIFL